MNRGILVRVINFIAFALGLASVGLFLFFAFGPFETNNIYLGLIMLSTAIPHLVIFLVGRCFKDAFKIVDFVFMIISVVLGVVFIFAPAIPVEIMVLIWASFDIIRGIYHAFNSVVELKHNKLEIIELACDATEIIFSIILIFEKTEGITMHLVVMASTTIVLIVKFIIDFVIEWVREVHD